MSMTLNRTLIPVLTLLVLQLCQVADCKAESLTAQSIIERMGDKYAKASSYQDTGIIMDKGNISGQSQSVIKFKTYFVRPHFFRFEWLDRSGAASEERLNVVWNDGKQTFAYHSWWAPTVEKQKDIGSGIAGAAGSPTVPNLLMAEVGGFNFTQLTNLSVVGEEKFEEEDCYIVRGEGYGVTRDVWVSKRDFLIRKTKLPRSDEIEIRRDVKLDSEIPIELFNFTPPLSKPVYHAQEEWKLFLGLFGAIALFVFGGMLTLYILSRLQKRIRNKKIKQIRLMPPAIGMLFPIVVNILMEAVTFYSSTGFISAARERTIDFLLYLANWPSILLRVYPATLMRTGKLSYSIGGWVEIPAAAVNMLVWGVIGWAIGFVIRRRT